MRMVRVTTAGRQDRRWLAAAMAFGSLGMVTPAAAHQHSIATTPAAECEIMERQVEDVLAKLTIQEKIALLHGGFGSGGVPRLSIKPILFADGPVGVRLNFDTDAKRSTALPATLALAATWDRARSRAYAGVLADEMLALDRHVLFGPGLNLMRDPHGGRNFEYMGEDPFLTAELGIAYVGGLQDKGVGATIKHFVANEAERYRHYTDSRVDPVTLHEVYLYPFLRALGAGAWALMTGNNATNGRHMGENGALVQSLLRDRLGWDGTVLTDWRSAYRVEESAPAGVDMTLGLSDYVYGQGMPGFVGSGAWPQAALDAQVRHVLRLYARVGLLSGKRLPGSIATPGHAAFARETVAAAATLLKNERATLPYSGKGRIILLGPGADEVMYGGGSGNVNKGIGNVSLASGLAAAIGGQNLLRQVPDTGGRADLIVYAVKGVEQHEGEDQTSIALDPRQVAEIHALAGRGTPLVLVVQTGSALDLSPIVADADAILLTWFGGQEFGNGVADVLLGKMEPGGRLPVTLAAEDRYPATMMGTWPAKLIRAEHPGGVGAPVPSKPELRFPVIAYRAAYDEGLLIGYRWFDKRALPVTYPFGYGLGYTSFALSGLGVEQGTDGPKLSVTATNTGTRLGSTVVQVYATLPGDRQDRPDRELRGFARVTVEPGRTAQVSIDVPWQLLTRYDSASDSWITDAGEYRLRVGQSSRDLPLETVIHRTTAIRFDRP